MRLDFDRPFMLRAQVSIAAARKGTIVFNIDARYDFTDFHDLLLTDGAEMQRMQQHVRVQISNVTNFCGVCLRHRVEPLLLFFVRFRRFIGDAFLTSSSGQKISPVVVANRLNVL